MKTHSVGAQLFHADGHDRAKSCFLQFCKHLKSGGKKVPNNENLL